MIVVDTNILAYLLVPSPHSAAALAAHARDPEWAAPLLWRSEFRSVLVQILRAGGLTLSQALAHFADAEAVLGGEEFVAQTASVLELAASTGASAYDCEFAGLARDLGVPLVTADRRLAAAFPAFAVPLEEFARPRRHRS